MPAGARADAAGHALFATATLLAAGYLLHLGRRTTFFYDEWTFIRTRRDWHPGTFLDPHNGHFSAVPVLAYHLLFATAGLRAYLPYRLLLMAFHAGACFALYRYGRRRLGPLPAVLPPALLLLNGPGYQDLLWPFQIGFVGALGFGVAALLALDGPPGRRRDLAGCLCLLASVASSGVGVAMLAGAIVRVLLRRQWRRWWMVGLPAAVFVAWFADYDASLPGSSGTAAGKAGYLLHFFRAAVGALTGHAATRAVTLATVLSWLVVALVLARLAYELRARRLPVDLLAAVTVALVLLGLTAATRAQDHDFGASRYAYTGGFTVLLVLIELLRGIDLRRWPARAGVGLLAVATAASVVTGLQPLRLGAHSLTGAARYLRADLAAVQLSDPPPSYQPNRRLIPFQDSGSYLAAVRALGSPALPVTELPRQAPDVRDDVDRVLRQAGELTVTGAIRQPGGPALPVILAPGLPESLAPQPGCLLLRPEAPARRLTVRLSLPWGGLTLGSAATIRLAVRRFGPTLVAFGRLPAGRGWLIRPRFDAAPARWTVQLGASAPVRACAAG
ncbi:MAG TPA: hypothetical protein VMB79_08405 [Jatrophihabitans sp.]|nr:hypothetical protein [Jatrophihabitans sp.]